MDEQHHHVPSPPLQLTTTNRQRLAITFLCFHLATTLHIILQEIVLPPALAAGHFELLSLLIAGVFVSAFTIKLHGMATGEWERGLSPGINLLLSGVSLAVAYWVRRWFGLGMRDAGVIIGEAGSRRSKL